MNQIFNRKLPSFSNTMTQISTIYNNAITFYHEHEELVTTLCIGILLLFAAGIISYLCSERHRNRKIRKKIANSKFLYYKDFDKNWIKPGKPQRRYGYKYNDIPGCYIITLYDHKISSSREYLRYKNIYIGQSVNIFQRVHNHIHGKGKGDVYADIKYGQEAYIVFMPCKKEKMNALEKKLIRAFNSTKSYNITKGGSKHR